MKQNNIKLLLYDDSMKLRAEMDKYINYGIFLVLIGAFTQIITNELFNITWLFAILSYFANIYSLYIGAITSESLSQIDDVD